MGGLSIWHLLILLGIILIFSGGRKLPELGKGLGEAIRGFKKGLDGEEIDVTESSKRDSLNAGGAQQSTGAQQQQKAKDRNEA